MFSADGFSQSCKLTRDCSGCSAGPDWRPCCDTTPPRTSWVSADRSTKSDTRWWLIWCVTHRQVTFYFVNVVFDSQRSTGWSLGSSSTSHPPLSTLPTHLQRTEKKQSIAHHYDKGFIHVKLLQQYVCYPRLLLLSTSFSSTLSCQLRSLRPRQICWRGAGNRWPSRLVKSKSNYLAKM